MGALGLLRKLNRLLGLGMLHKALRNERNSSLKTADDSVQREEQDAGLKSYVTYISISKQLKTLGLKCIKDKIINNVILP